jgi:hypothetical protein
VHCHIACRSTAQNAEARRETNYRRPSSTIAAQDSRRAFGLSPKPTHRSPVRQVANSIRFRRLAGRATSTVSLLPPPTLPPHPSRSPAAVPTCFASDRTVPFIRRPVTPSTANHEPPVRRRTPDKRLSHRMSDGSCRFCCSSSSSSRVVGDQRFRITAATRRGCAVPLQHRLVNYFSGVDRRCSGGGDKLMTDVE